MIGPGNIRELRNVHRTRPAYLLLRAAPWDFGLASDRSRSDFLSLRGMVAKWNRNISTDAEMRPRREARESFLLSCRRPVWKIKGVDGAAELLGLKPTTFDLRRIEKMGFEAACFERPRFAKVTRLRAQA